MATKPAVKKEDKKTPLPTFLNYSHEQTVDQVCILLATRLMEGGDLAGQTDEIVAQAATYYKADPQYIATKIEQEQTRLISRQQAAAAAEKARIAAEEAQERAVEAAAAAAAAEGKVVVNVPKAFKLQVTPGKFEEIKAGTQTMSAEWASHWYSKAHGVTIVGQASKKKD